jgi:hypothetical protein
MKRSAPLKRRTPLRRSKPMKRGGALKRGSGLKRTGSLRRTVRRETAAERRARLHFNHVVCEDRSCFYAELIDCDDLQLRRPGHECDGVLDAHHLVEKQWIKQYFGDLPEDKLLTILFSPLIGCPLCRLGHSQVKTLHVYRDELTEECIEFCEDVDRRYGDVPMPGGAKRPSMLARLEQECPRRSKADRG